MTVVHVLGTHGVPAAYGGFETAAQEVGLHLRDRGWDVHVYCQVPGEGPTTTDEWNGLTRVLVHEPRAGLDRVAQVILGRVLRADGGGRSEEHTSELQSH